MSTLLSRHPLLNNAPILHPHPATPAADAYPAPSTLQPLRTPPPPQAHLASGYFTSHGVGVVSAFISQQEMKVSCAQINQDQDKCYFKGKNLIFFSFCCYELWLKTPCQKTVNVCRIVPSLLLLLHCNNNSS